MIDLSTMHVGKYIIHGTKGTISPDAWLIFMVFIEGKYTSPMDGTGNGRRSCFLDPVQSSCSSLFDRSYDFGSWVKSRK